MLRATWAGLAEQLSPGKASSSAVVGLAVAALVAYAPEYDGLTPPGHHALFVLLLASWLWVTSSLPPFAVALLVIALQIALLGNPIGAFASGDPRRWEMFVAPWASPVMWLFLGGLTLAAATERTGLDRRLATAVLDVVGLAPRRVLLGVMGVAFVLSMFMSNTAATALMVAIVSPMARWRNAPELFARQLLMGVAAAANLGGMATIIGTPPNALAAASVAPMTRIDYATWLVLGLPPALVLVTVAYRMLARAMADGPALEPPEEEQEAPLVKGRRRDQLFVGLVFGITILVWVTEQLHGIPTAVVAVMPIAALSVGGIVGEQDMRRLPWEVLVLVAGGLSLGVGVSETGLGAWLVSGLPADRLPAAGVALGLAIPTALLSNFMSNTAAAAVVLPMALALGGAAPVMVSVPVALAASTAMCLAVSTPPNALVFATGQVAARDLLRLGLTIGLVGPPLVVGWVWLAGRYVLGS